MTKANTPVPLWRRTLAQWPAEWREEWIERSAIIEYDGKVPRAEAEKRAFDVVARMKQAAGK